MVTELHSTVMSKTHHDPAADVRAALAKVIDPELRRPITELGMVKGIQVGPDGDVHVEIYLTTAACPKKTEISERVSQAVADVPGTGAVKVSLDVMNDEQRTELRKQLRGDAREPVIPFAQPGSLTRVYAVASGKGGVGKSTVTVNLAAAMAARGMSVGVLDADIHGHSIPRMMGTTDRPTQVESMILPPIAHEVKVISIAQFTEGNTAVVWRGPMLHRALQQFLVDVYWGDLDVLLLDLPPGTGDIAISVAQLIPNAEILVVTTPQHAAAEVAERAGSIALQTRQRIVGVVENMSWLALPDGSQLQVFGQGGGQQVAERLSRAVGADVPLLGQIPLDPALVVAGDTGVPIVLSAPDSPVGKELRNVADGLSSRRRGLAGMSLGLDPTKR
ncbi:MAG TPA: Mrp/NBP35 family ATP-binding protein [Mycobacterium sp.]|nr:Mrp/NBP35 family ATP-binding protein [Mycobacterium sp.]